MRRTGVVMTAIGTSGLATTTASAQSGSQQGILADGVGEGGDFRAFFSGLINRYQGGYGAPKSVEDLADDARNEFEANSDLWISYGNWLLEEYDVSSLGTATVGVEFAITRGRWPFRGPESVQTTIDATYDDEAEEFTALEWRLEEPDNPEHEFLVKNNAAENAADELKDFRRQYIDPDGGHTLPDREYISKLAGKYSGTVLVDEQSVLELLLGEIDG